MTNKKNENKKPLSWLVAVFVMNDSNIESFEIVMERIWYLVEVVDKFVVNEGKLIDPRVIITDEGVAIGIWRNYPVHG
jgi:hypothetical protein